MIHLQVLDAETQYHMIESNECVRIEIAVLDGQVVTHVYRKGDHMPEDDPVARFDASNGYTDEVLLNDTPGGPVRHRPRKFD